MQNENNVVPYDAFLKKKFDRDLAYARKGVVINVDGVEWLLSSNLDANPVKVFSQSIQLNGAWVRAWFLEDV